MMDTLGHFFLFIAGRALSEEEATDFEGQSHPFYVSPLLQAFKSAFDWKKIWSQVNERTLSCFFNLQFNTNKNATF